MARQRRSKTNTTYFTDIEKKGGDKMEDEEKHCELCYAEIKGTHYRKLDDLKVCFSCYESHLDDN